MISRVCQWPFEAHAFIVPCFPFRKNIVSVNLRGVAMRSCTIIVALFVLYLLTKSSTAGRDVCIRRANAFRRLRVSRYVGISFSLIACLYYATGKTRILHIRVRRDTCATFREAAYFHLSTNFYLLYKNVGMTEADFKLNTVKKRK